MIDNWIKKYRENGIKGLANKRNPVKSSKKKITKEVKK